MKAKEYTVVHSTHPSQLGAMVTKMLAEGWELYGEPFAGNVNQSGMFCQSMVKFEKGAWKSDRREIT